MSKENTIARLKKVLLNDKINMPNGLMQLIKSDLVKILSAYFEFDKSNLDIVIGNDKDGLCDIKITAKAERIKPPRFL